jgi:hypothetical protein
MACAVKRRRFPVGANPTRQPLQPEATGAAMEVTKWLKPSDRNFNPHTSGDHPLAVASFTDALVMRHVSALKRARRVADITRQLAAIVEVTMEYLANQHRGKLRADCLELMESLGSSRR